MNNTLITILAVVVVGGGILFFTNKSDDEATSRTTEENGSSAGGMEDGNIQAMTFFITSENPGTGANLGGLSGADAHCQALAQEVGAGSRAWRAYLSAEKDENDGVVNARDRIGAGPWHNSNGDLIARSVAELHSDTNAINKETGLTEKGSQVNGRGDSPNVHDILTGSASDGTLALSESGAALTCNDWTSESADGSAMVGHHDRLGPDTLETATSWNAAHGSRGCSLSDLNGTGGGGLLYCFAVE